jgi:iron complex outermembrane receptor protein
VILVNGARISNFAEVRDIPTEAIARVEILPEEVALKYGYRADQKVVNLVLRRRFRATTAEGGYKFPTQGGGGDTADIHANVLHILRDNRFMVDVQGQQPERAVRERAQHRPAALRRRLSQPDPRTEHLVAQHGFQPSDQERRVRHGQRQSGLHSRHELAGPEHPGLSGPLRRQSDSVTGHLGGGLLGAIKGWRWALTGNAEISDSDSTTERVDQRRRLQGLLQARHRHPPTRSST